MTTFPAARPTYKLEELNHFFEYSQDVEELFEVREVTPPLLPRKTKQPPAPRPGPFKRAWQKVKKPKRVVPLTPPPEEEEEEEDWNKYGELPGGRAGTFPRMKKHVREAELKDLRDQMMGEGKYKNVIIPFFHGCPNACRMESLIMSHMRTRSPNHLCPSGTVPRNRMTRMNAVTPNTANGRNSSCPTPPNTHLRARIPLRANSQLPATFLLISVKSLLRCSEGIATALCTPPLKRRPPPMARNVHPNLPRKRLQKSLSKFRILFVIIAGNGFAREPRSMCLLPRKSTSSLVLRLPQKS